MSAPLQYKAYSDEEALQLLDGCFKTGETTAIETLMQAAQDPIEPQTEDGKYRLHPLLWTTILGLVGIAGVLVFFGARS